MRFILFVGLATCLVACSGGQRAAEFSGARLASVFSEVSFSRPKTAEPITVTRALVDATPGAVMEARAEAIDRTGYLSRTAVRNDKAVGTIAVWQSGDNAQLVLRDGVLVTTRGLGFSLVSSEVTGTIQALATRSDAQVTRRMEILSGDNQRRVLGFSCQLRSFGTEDLFVVDQTFATVRLQERCGSPAGVFTNDYWIDTKTGLIRKSRQWAGPEIGYFALTLLKN